MAIPAELYTNTVQAAAVRTEANTNRAVNYGGSGGSAKAKTKHALGKEDVVVPTLEVIQDYVAGSTYELA